MCRRATIVYEVCTCVRCRFADILDENESWYYPHHGTPIVGHDPHPAYNDYEIDDPPHPVYTGVIVEPEDRCESAVFAANERDFYLNCDDPPDDISFQYRYDEDNEICEECVRICYALSAGDIHPRRAIDQLSVSSGSVSSDERVSPRVPRVPRGREYPRVREYLDSLGSLGSPPESLRSLGSLSLGSLPGSGSSGETASEIEEEERRLAIHQRIYRSVLFLMGYPEDTPLPQRVGVLPPL
ncbi:hypothetical protein F4678DRAFT_480759 [Xylaria arbuscula]|nr:hypothetical protein F4678DRAFT_480759 [Xylaria arbuscula]